MATVNRTRKYIAEFIGTFVLVLVGCGTAVAVGCNAASPDAAYFMTAVAFGLAVVAMAYSVGNVSGCHINPAISLAMFLDRRLDFTDLIGYVAAQCLGALAACIPIGIINGFDCGMGANVASGFFRGLVVEFFLTFIFVFVVMGATDRAANASTASNSGSGFMSMPWPPPNGASSTVRCLSCVHVRRSCASNAKMPAARARPMIDAFR